MEKEDFVSLEVAKLLKEKGFSESCLSAYDKKGHIFYLGRTSTDWNNERAWAFSRPTLYDAQKWIRTKHNIHIEIGNYASGYYWFLNKADNGTFIRDHDMSGENDGGCWDKYEEALNAGVLETLKLI